MEHRNHQRNTKIVATVGPACSSAESIRELLQTGVNVARLNFSHGTHADHAAIIQRLRQAASELNRPLAILQDLQGPKIRTGDLAAGSVELIAGETLTLTTQLTPGDARLVSVDFPELPQSVLPGGRILLDDGNLELVVTAVGEDWVETRVVVGGILKTHKGMNLPNGRISIAAFTEKDLEDLAFGLEQGVDAVALSFVRSAQDVRDLRQAIQRLQPNLKHFPIIAKLERPEALVNLEEIVEVSDGVMVARGDLGVEMSPEFVPTAQKRIIECANRHARLVITATQMLDSMIQNPRPTRAEASDVANAIFDGTDAVMLSGETASGKYPFKAVQTMHAISVQAEANTDLWGHWQGPKPADGCSDEVEDPKAGGDDTFFMTMAARALAHDRNVAALAIFTMSGRTAMMMSKTRPDVPILAFTPDRRTYQRLAMYWGVQAQLVPQATTLESMLADVESTIRRGSLVQSGQQVVLICGYPVGETCPTNLALLHTIR